MNYFKLTNAIISTDRVLKILVGAALLLATPIAMASSSYWSIPLLIAAYLILARIMKWDLIGYIIEIVLRTSEPTHPPHNIPAKPPFRMRTCRGG